MSKKNLKYYDPQIKVKNKALNERLHFIPGTNIPMPSEVEISESGMCNRKCHFCPRSDPDYEHRNEFIEFSLFKKLCDELQSLEFSGLFIFSGFVEPLLDKNIYKLIAYAKKKLPKARIEIITNGDVLNEKRLKKLYDSGLDRMQVSLYDGEEQHKKFIELGKKIHLSKDRYVLRARYLPEEENFGITLSNRGGMLENADFKIPARKEMLNQVCYYPSYKFFLDYNGDVLMCSHDWGKKNILGNLKKDKLIDIWLSEDWNKTREFLNSGNRSLKPCNVCDVSGTLIGRKHFEAWNKVINEKSKNK
jgi:radical SAM protein with 4Fe4S-binding SPASM domain